MIGIFCGQVSGGLEALDLDIPTKKDPGFIPGSVPPPLHQPWLDLVKDHGAEELVNRLVLERSPSGGLHYYWRCSSIRKKGDVNKKLAHVLIKKDANGKEIYKDCIELQSSGFFVVCHPSPGYELLQGSLEAIPEITPEERDLLLSLARRLDQKPVEAYVATSEQKSSPKPGQTRPGDDFNQRGTWDEVLDGWTMLNRHWNGLRLVLRPGKTNGHSGGIGQGTMGDHLIVWTDQTDLDPHVGYSKFHAFTILHHQGDYSAAAAALSSKGYGQSSFSAQPPAPPSTEEAESLDATEEAESLCLIPYTTGQWKQDLSRVTAGRKSGYPSLDKIAMIPEGAITIVAGRPNMGKTTVLLNLLAGMEDQDEEEGSYLFFSYEEANKILMVKLLMSMAGIIFDPSKNLSHYLHMVRDGWEPGQHPDLDQAYDKLRELTDSGRIILVDKPHKSDDLVKVIEATAEAKPIRAVFLDYIQKIRPSKSGQARYLDIAQTSETIRAIAVNLNIPFIVGAQMGRPDKKAEEKRGLRLDNLRESGDLEQDANLVIGIHRNRVQEQEEEEDPFADVEEEMMEAHILKNRNGPLGRLTWSFSGPTYKIKEARKSL